MALKSMPSRDHSLTRFEAFQSNEGGTDDPRVFVQRFTASDRATREVLAALEQRLEMLEIDRDDRESAELLLAEVLNNIGEHAYAGRGGPVELTVEIERSGLTCELCDQGASLPGGAMPGNGLPPIDPPDDVPEGGFGWHIIRCLASDLRYRREDGWNRLQFRFSFDGFD